MNTEIRNALVMEHMEVVKIIAKQYYIHAYLREDLEQEGYLGLIAAAEKFNPEVGVKFESYASWWVRRYIERAIHQYGQVVSLPDRMLITDFQHKVCTIEEVETMLSIEQYEEDKQQEAQEERMRLLEEAIRSLSIREQMVIRYMNGMGVQKRDYRWLAEQLKMTAGTVRQVHCRAIHKLIEKCL